MDTSRLVGKSTAAALPAHTAIEDTATEENVWREDDDFRINGTVLWVCSSSYLSDLVKYRIMLSFVMPWILQQLSISSVGWEKKTTAKVSSRRRARLSDDFAVRRQI